MKLLVDTHAFLWAWQDAPRLSRRARTLIIDTENQVFLSVVSGWEMAIKSSLGKLGLAVPIRQLLEDEREAMEIRLLPIDVQHLVALQRLPFHHRDPFDRMLAAQAAVEGLVIVSADRIFERYGLDRRW